jgi:pSer/pThr/pTyr-binding forkhead associated (FHA) protein
MADLIPVLVGTAGLVNGECFVLSRDVELTIGRSRACDVSLRRISAYLQTPPADRDNDHDFNTVSRRHVRIKVVASEVTLQDLSTNGSFCNGEQIRESQHLDLNQGGCTVRLGTRESFQLLLLPKDDPRVKDLQPISPGSGAKDTDKANAD